MNLNDFTRVVKSFAEKPADLDIEKGNMIVQIREELIDLKLLNKQGNVYVHENEQEFSAERWIFKRLANLPLLANRILDYINDENNYVDPSGQYLEEINLNPDENKKEVPEVLPFLVDMLNERPSGVTSVHYLTSEAGEGKTTVINQIARSQAHKFKNSESDWLVLPVELGGRPLIRLDDIIIATLLNKFRFQYLYFDSLIELIRLNVVVLAIDGFEEMFVETAGEAVSALGNLMQHLEDSGSVLIAARKAYFEYKNFETQAKLFDSLHERSISFSQMSLNKWENKQFIEFCNKIGYANGQNLISEATEALGDANHPLLNRAYLATRFIKLMKDQGDDGSLISKLREEPSNYFNNFINNFLTREAENKWIDKAGDPPKPLLTIEQHHELLSNIAEEMWMNKTQIMKSDLLLTITGLYCESQFFSPDIKRQIHQRIFDHSLLFSDKKQNIHRFDHEELFQYYVGFKIHYLIKNDHFSDLEKLFRIKALPSWSIEITANKLGHNEDEIIKIINKVNKLISVDIPGTFTKENCGGLILRLLCLKGEEKVTVTNLSFPENAFSGKTISIKNILFKNCYFYPTSFCSTVKNCTFINCEFHRIETLSSLPWDNVVFENPQIHCLSAIDMDQTSYQPTEIRSQLKKKGIHFIQKNNTDESIPPEPDEHFVIFERAIKAFLRNTAVNENTFITRLRTKANIFKKEIIPVILKEGIFEEVEYKGQGEQKRYKLKIQMSSINTALKECNGNFEKFIDLVK